MTAVFGNSNNVRGLRPLPSEHNIFPRYSCTAVFGSVSVGEVTGRVVEVGRIDTPGALLDATNLRKTAGVIS